MRAGPAQPTFGKTLMKKAAMQLHQPHRPARLPRLLSALLCLLLPTLLTVAAFSAQAQGKTVYKVQLPDGKIEFTDSPPPGAKILDTITPQTNITLPRPVAPAAGTASGAAPRSGIDAAMREVEQAERALTQARRNREAGREPREGETQGIRSGGTRTTAAYEARQKALEDDVVSAEERVKRANEARNAAR
jgi:hypothetical protein